LWVFCEIYGCLGLDLVFGFGCLGVFGFWCFGVLFVWFAGVVFGCLDLVVVCANACDFVGLGIV